MPYTTANPVPEVLRDPRGGSAGAKAPVRARAGQQAVLARQCGNGADLATVNELLTQCSVLFKPHFGRQGLDFEKEGNGARI
jgi:hypothetical protein